MKLTIKIIDSDIIDCSSCYNYIYPNPESRELLLEMILRIYESDVVSRIGQFKFSLDWIELQSPEVIGEWGYKDEKVKLFELQRGQEAENNKLSGLFVEKEEKMSVRINKANLTSQLYYIEPGLNGIRKAIFYLKALYNNDRDILPDYLKNVELTHFRFTGGVIWKMNEDKEWLVPTKNGIYDFISEHDTIGVSSTGSDMSFGFGNFGGDSSAIFTFPHYLDHLNAITEVMNDIIPGKFIAGPEELSELLEFDVLKKEGTKLVAGDEDAHEKNLERFEIYSLARSFDEDYVDHIKKKFQALKERVDRGEDLSHMEKLEFEEDKKIVKALKNNF